MTRLRRIENRNRIFFVTFNLAEGTPHLAPAERDLILDLLQQLRGPLEFAIFGYVVMPSHVHQLVLPRRESLVRIIRDWKSKSGLAIAKRRHISGSIWQRSYFDFICRRARDFSEKLEYIHLNPVVAGLAEKAHDWRWSSFLYYARGGQPPIIPDHIEFSGDPQELLWPAPWRRV